MSTQPAPDDAQDGQDSSAEEPSDPFANCADDAAEYQPRQWGLLFGCFAAAVRLIALPIFWAVSYDAYESAVQAAGWGLDPPWLFGVLALLLCVILGSWIAPGRGGWRWLLSGVPAFFVGIVYVVHFLSCH